MKRPDPLAGSPVSDADQMRANELSTWAEDANFEISQHATVTHGAGAAAEGRALLKAAIGADELARALIRDSLDH